MKKILMLGGLLVCFGFAIPFSLPVNYVEATAEGRKEIMTSNADERSEQLPSNKAQQTCCPIVELRQYTLHPGKRDVLIDLFDREFVETQEAVGMSVIGQFRDLDEPDRFVWLRGFPDMSSRAKSLTDFYRGPVWKAHSKTANTTMIDSDNVLLLRPALSTSGFSFKSSDRPQPGTKEVSKGIVVATIYYFDAPVSSDFLDFFEHTLKPVVTETDASVVAYLVSENSLNTFPALPVREGEHVFLWFMRFADQAEHERYESKISRSQRWNGEISKELGHRLKRSPEVLRLSPTSRSQLHG